MKILIRRVMAENRDDARYTRAFEGIPAEKWSLFEDAKELDAVVPRE